jgi:hypothetical protein
LLDISQALYRIYEGFNKRENCQLQQDGNAALSPSSHSLYKLSTFIQEITLIPSERRKKCAAQLMDSK